MFQSAAKVRVVKSKRLGNYFFVDGITIVTDGRRIGEGTGLVGFRLLLIVCVTDADRKVPDELVVAGFDGGSVSFAEGAVFGRTPPNLASVAREGIVAVVIGLSTEVAVIPPVVGDARKGVFDATGAPGAGIFDGVAETDDEFGKDGFD